jgi:hypothetical protein
MELVEAKLRAWKMDHGSTEWKDGLRMSGYNVRYCAMQWW